MNTGQHMRHTEPCGCVYRSIDIFGPDEYVGQGWEIQIRCGEHRDEWHRELVERGEAAIKECR